MSWSESQLGKKPYSPNLILEDDDLYEKALSMVHDRWVVLGAYAPPPQDESDLLRSILWYQDPEVHRNLLKWVLVVLLGLSEIESEPTDGSQVTKEVAQALLQRLYQGCGAVMLAGSLHSASTPTSLRDAVVNLSMQGVVSP